MANPLATYVQDHLAGAQFAISMLEDMREHDADQRLARLAEDLLPEIEADRAVLQQFAERIGDAGNAPKEAAARMVQKVSRIKLSADDPLGAYEALETLCLGIQGKLALWTAFTTLDDESAVQSLDLDQLAKRAIGQHARAERVRLAMAPSVLAVQEAADRAAPR